MSKFCYLKLAKTHTWENFKQIVYFVQHRLPKHWIWGFIVPLNANSHEFNVLWNMGCQFRKLLLYLRYFEYIKDYRRSVDTSQWENVLIRALMTLPRKGSWSLRNRSTILWRYHTNNSLRINFTVWSTVCIHSSVAGEAM